MMIGGGRNGVNTLCVFYLRGPKSIATVLGLRVSSWETRTLVPGTTRNQVTCKRCKAKMMTQWGPPNQPQRTMPYSCDPRRVGGLPKFCRGEALLWMIPYSFWLSCLCNRLTFGSPCIKWMSLTGCLANLRPSSRKLPSPGVCRSVELNGSLGTDQMFNLSICGLPAASCPPKRLPIGWWLDMLDGWTVRPVNLRPAGRRLPPPGVYLSINAFIAITWPLNCHWWLFM